MPVPIRADTMRKGAGGIASMPPTIISKGRPAPTTMDQSLRGPVTPDAMVIRGIPRPTARVEHQMDTPCGTPSMGSAAFQPTKLAKASKSGPRRGLSSTRTHHGSHDATTTASVNTVANPHWSGVHAHASR